MTLYWNDHNGKPWAVCSCLKAWLPAYESEILRRGLIRTCLDLFQTIGGYSKSGGTHATGGAADTGQYSDEHIRIARKMGAAAWHRTPEQGFIHHTHLVLNGCPHAAAAAKGQVEDYKRGYNGLVGKSRRREKWAPRKLRTWDEGIAWARSQAAKAPAPTPVHIDLRPWKWNGPVGKEDHPIEVRNLAGYAKAPYFVQMADRIRFRAPVDGVTTAHSDNPRSELRELTNGAEAEWSTTQDSHRLAGEFAVVELPGKKKGSKHTPGVVTAQLHDDLDDVVMLLVQGSTVFASWSKGKDKGSELVPLLTGLTLHQRVKYEITAAGGVIAVRVGDRMTTKRLSRSRVYAKAGAYCQGNESNATGAAEVDYFALTITHS